MTESKESWFGSTLGLREDGGWVDALKQEWASSSADLRERWRELLVLCQDAGSRSTKDVATVQDETESQCAYPRREYEHRDFIPEPGSEAYQEALAGAAPAQEWLKKVADLAEGAGGSRFTARLAYVLRSAVQSGIGLLNRKAANREILRGVIWTVAALPEPEMIDALRQFAIWSVEHKTAQASTIAIALAFTNSEHAAGALRMIALGAKRESPRIRFDRYASHVEGKIGITPEDSAEQFVPTFGLAGDGKCKTDFGASGSIELRIENSEAVLRYFNGSGKEVAAAPAAMKRDRADEVQELRLAAKGLTQLISNQRNRIESMFLAQRQWTFSTWRARYLDHAIVGNLARRLIWQVNGTPVLFVEGRALDARGEAVDTPDTAEVQLWHPLGQKIEDVLGWRTRLETLGVTQPFKQAHREVYVVTDAERATSTYSNRFAAHILRQTQFRVLTIAKKWDRPFLGGWDSGDSGTARRELPEQWRAEFWISGVGPEREPTGGFLHISTDRVRFFHANHAEPVPLANVPPLIFSEVMRDVDLFVGVASVGNDPGWSDGGPEGRFRDYWQGVSFGELNATAKTRKEVLQRLVPKLKIGDRCSFEEKFLVVKGSLRTYKIHLGSGNILMAPNDQYLCIVAKQSEIETGDVFLPFEGDRTLSVILSKAFLLANDAKISDSTILSQIKWK